MSLGSAVVGNIEHDHAGITPGGVGRVAVNDRVVQTVAPAAGHYGVSPAARFMPGIHHRAGSRGFGSLMSTVMNM